MRTTRWTAHVTAIVAVAALAAVGARLGQRDVAFCRAVFAGLTRGDASVQRHIAWERFNALGADVGAAYDQLTEEEKLPYQQAFIKGFAYGFRQQGGRLAAFTKWRVAEKRADSLVVAADYPLKQNRLLLRVSRARPRQLEALQWQ